MSCTSLKFASRDIIGQQVPMLNITRKIILLVTLLIFTAPIYAFSAPAENSTTAKAEISAKLDEMAKNHEMIMKELEEIKKELYIVKIRASR